MQRLEEFAASLWSWLLMKSETGLNFFNFQLLGGFFDSKVLKDFAQSHLVA